MGPAIAIDRLNELAEVWSAAMLRATWQGGLLIAAAWALASWRRGPSPRVACWFWRLADLKLIVALFWASPLLLPLLPPPGVDTRASLSAVRSDSAAVLDLDQPVLPDVEGDEVPTRQGVTPASLLFLAWLAGVFGASVLAARGAIETARLRRSCSPVDRPELRATAHDLARAIGLRRIPELLSGPHVDRPMLVGAFRPAILLPPAMSEGETHGDALRAILAHELAHVRRGDLAWMRLSAVVRALFFFHPLVRLAHREATLAREADCDVLALEASGIRPSDYARILLEIAAGRAGRTAHLASVIGMAGPAGTLKRRLIAMKMSQCQQLSRRRRISWTAALLLAGAVGVVPWQLVPRPARAQDGPPAPPSASGRSGRADRTPAERIKLAEDRLEVDRARLKVAEAVVKQAQAQAEAATARLEYRDKTFKRIASLVQRRAVEGRLLDEEEDRRQMARAEERASQHRVETARAELAKARAEVREAEGLHDIAVAEASSAPDARDALRAAQARLREARLDVARTEVLVARQDVARAEADRAGATATVNYRTRQVRRLESLVARKAIEQRLVDEQELKATEARKAETAAAAAIEQARARLKAAEANLKVIESTSRPDPGPAAPPRVPRRNPSR